MNPIVYTRNVISELRQVRWPSRREVVHLTAVVLVLSTVVGLYIGGLDFLFTHFLKLIFK